MLTKTKISQAVRDIRSAEQVLTSHMSDLHAAGMWSGADSDRFQKDWNDLVRNRLLGAATTLEVASFITVAP